MIGELARYIDTGKETHEKAAAFFSTRLRVTTVSPLAALGENDYFGSPDKTNEIGRMVGNVNGTSFAAPSVWFTS